MTSFKKVFSILMAVVMLLGVLSTGIVGIAADIDLNAQYAALAAALKNEYVADLTNYTISNSTLNNGAEGFDAEANGFAYEHRVTARDNADGDILKAANRFYYIAENLISTEYGTGLYAPDMLVSSVSARLREFFAGGTETYYEDFYGQRYYPTEDEIAAYENAVSLMEAVGREITQASLSSFRIYFMQKDEFTFYNVETLLQYFVGNVIHINAGNWYHRFVFVAETSIDTWLTEKGSIKNLPDTTIVVRKAVYEFTYHRTFNDLRTKAYYAFNEPQLENVWQHYGEEFGFDNYSDDLSFTLTTGGQAVAFMIDEYEDHETVPHLWEVYNVYQSIIEAPVNASGETWDVQFSKMNETQLAAVANANKIVSHMDDLGSTYSNDALLSMFGENVGNMISLAYIIKPMSTLPERTVRGTAKYTVTTTKLNSIVTDIDNLIHNPEGDTAKRVGTIVKQFFNTNNDLFAGSAVQGLEFDDLKDFVSIALNGLLFRDSIINKLVTFVYPLLCDLIDEKVIGAVKNAVGDTLSGAVSSLLTDLLNNNDLAIYPNQLANNLMNKYGSKYGTAAAVLTAAGDDWEKVNVDALTWGVDEADIDRKATAFTDALCAALGGFRLLLVTIMCGDAEYKNNNRKNNLSWASSNQFTEYYDKLLINILQQGLILRSQGGYTKLIIPLLRALGLNEQSSYQGNCTGYLSSAEYHRMVDLHGDNCLRMIIEPIIYWVTQVLAAKPFETLWKALPNLIYLFIRGSDVPIDDNWTNTTSNDDTHDHFDTCQTHSISTILNHVYVNLTLVGFSIKPTSIGSFLNEKMDLISSINGLLNSVLDLEYIKGTTGVVLPCAYTNGTDIVLKDSVEYVTNPSAYPTELLYCYTYDSSYTPQSGSNTPQYAFEKGGIYTVKIENPEYLKASFKIPQIQEKKITSTTTERADGTLANPNAIGVLTSWNTIDVRNPGVVLLYVLRFVISALGYKYDISESAENQGLPYLIACLFRMNSYSEEDPLDKELFQGLNLKDIIYNVMLHPDDALCALLELFYSNEQGDKYNNVPYTYGISEINYHNSVLLNKSVNPTLTYGTEVRYTQYWTREYAQDTIGNAGELVKNVLVMMGMDQFKDGFGPYLQTLLNENVFNNELVNKLFNMVYHLLGGLSGTVGFDIETMLEAVLDITYDPGTIGRTVRTMLGYSTEASDLLTSSTNWEQVFGTYTETDPISDEVHTITPDVDLDWGIDTAAEHGLTNHDAFLRVVSALLSPAAFLFRYLLADENLKLLGLIELDAYAGYHYAWIGLMEALSCPGVMSYNNYIASTLQSASGTKEGDAKVIYGLLSPLGGLIDKIYVDPISTVLNLIPNLLFFISIGGLNDLLNNFVHFAYVLLDILKPIVNGYDLLDGLLSNIEIKGYSLNLTLPLDVDFNGLISDLIGVLVGDSINLGGLELKLPYIDFHTLCFGKVKSYNSSEIRSTVRLDAGDGSDMITALFRLVFEVVFMQENRDAVTNFILLKAGTDEDGNPKLDSYDKRTLLQLINQLYDLMETYEVPDMLLFVVYQLVTKLTPVSSRLAPALSAAGITVQDLFGNISNPQSFIAMLTQVANNMSSETPAEAGGTASTTQAASGLFARLKAFFEKLIAFFRNLFS